MILLIKVIVAIWVVIKVIDITVAAYFNRMTVKREQYIKERWLKRYEKTIPAWFNLTNR